MEVLAARCSHSNIRRSVGNERRSSGLDGSEIPEDERESLMDFIEAAGAVTGLKVPGWGWRSPERIAEFARGNPARHRAVGPRIRLELPLELTERARDREQHYITG